ncbi:hypothetical protein AMTR_s00043p00153300 [Amborella trichopoda]|uniref:Uncharacterized protein n=1 Tax=Amborella trichopoda TaxID=13333 RepID=W1PX27_AMBTC|nr:hypothetical protein AMTR_s00043p00153300 [Amborella trichopoda]
MVEVFGPNDVWNGSCGIGSAARLLVILEAHGGLELSAGWTGAGATRNGAKLLPLLVACFITEVSLVCCLRTFGRALVAVGATSKPALLKCSEVRLISVCLALSCPIGAMLVWWRLGLLKGSWWGEWFKISGGLPETFQPIHNFSSRDSSVYNNLVHNGVPFFCASRACFEMRISLLHLLATSFASYHLILKFLELLFLNLCKRQLAFGHSLVAVGNH